MVDSHLGVRSGTAKSFVVGRHVHAKVVNAAKDADGTAQLGSGDQLPRNAGLSAPGIAPAIDDVSARAVDD
ncbi:hypothetical protein [Glutamicibacter protophormiae]|uniref:Uncharacterized protein n=1 Tax=Glutamicibacter protophormiae TaxID=37930 RepID=A0ABS4XTF6_GLUPR|nr:hypothetical protein [Glutamicibacter protophormiae]MBP2399783.1 hypothetical protein [Glutamicibacter protophormiae]GGL89133.1 hypothetical protein GCM10010038_18930 [Glutamicibacter protophormiae]